MVAHQPPDPDSFCTGAEPVGEVPAIHFPGGALFQTPIDPTKGSPGACGLTLDLVGQLQSALAPFQPFLDLLDVVAQMGQCVLLITEVIQNPFKIPDLLACLPDLATKVNKILTLVPVFPQGIVQFVTFVVDVLRFIGQQIACLVELLESIQEQFVEVGRIAQQINQTTDPTVRAGLETLQQCGEAQAEQQVGVAMAAFGPITRLLCTVRTLLALVGPEGKKIAKQLTIPDPSQISVLQDAIAALSQVRDVILGTVETIVALAAPFGGVLPPPEVPFVCALDLEDDEEPEEEATPLVTGLQDAVGAVLTTIPLAALSTDPDLTVFVMGTGFRSGSSRVYWGTSPVTALLVESNRIQIALPAQLRLQAGPAYVAVANEPAGGTSSFGGLSPGSSGTKVSRVFETQVA